MTDMKGSTSGAADFHASNKQWDETSCPICMDHPHNAVLVVCTSHDKGCRSYICDTSYRHSNCLDRFKKVKETNGNSSNARTNREESDGGSSSESDCLKCPLCRGIVLGWRTVKEARQYLDQKPRTCSRESCEFSGNYGELRRHARRTHPTTRPADVDPSRQRSWRRLERRREYSDVLSAVRPAMPGAIVIGDYVVNGGDGVGPGEGNGQWWPALFLFRMIGGPIGSPADEPRGSSRMWRTHRWSLGGHGNDDAPIPRRRRRFMRSSPNEEQP